MEKNGFLRKVTRYWFLPAPLFIALCVVGVAGVLSDKDIWFDVALLLNIGLLGVQVVMLVLTLVVRRWWAVLGTLAGLAVSLVFALFCIIGLAVGQHHPPKQLEPTLAEEDSLELADSLIVEDTARRGH